MFKRTRNLRDQIWRVMSKENSSDKAAKIFSYSLITLILLNILAFILYTVDGIRAHFELELYCFEIFSVLVFMIEYIFRIACCTADPQYSNSIRGRIKYALTPLAVIDFWSVAPFFIPVFGTSLLGIRFLRVLRIFRLAKFNRFHNALLITGRVIAKSKESLILIITFTSSIILISSILMYFVEREVQPDKFGSVPAAIWWAIITLTTIGYGDVAPITVAGKIITSLVALLGIGAIAFPAGIIGSGFVREMEKTKSEPAVCPVCGSATDEKNEQKT